MVLATTQEVGRQVQGPYQGSHRIKGPRPVPAHPMTVRMIFSALTQAPVTLHQQKMRVSGCQVMADRRFPQAMHLHAARHWHVCSAYQGNKAVLHTSYNRARGQGLQILKNVCMPCGISKISFIIRLLRVSFFTVS